jgi:uncharacterized membrane protein HdeD (DUF308 family)
MLEHTTRHWWTLTLRGVLAIIFALIAFAAPLSAVTALVIIFGAYALVGGIFALIAAARLSHASENWQPLIIEGVIGIIFGIIVFANPVGVGVFLVYIVAAWAILTGILEIAAAIRLRKALANEFWLITAGVLSLLFGVLLLVFPLGGFVTLAYILGAYAFLFGLLLVALSLRLRGLSGRIAPPI